MLFFGPISSMFDFLTFGVMLWLFHAGAALFQSGWFVESLATQTLVIFAIRTRRSPFFHSRPSRPLLIASLACVTLGALMPFLPTAWLLGFKPLPPGFFAVLLGMVLTYLALVELGKARFFRAGRAGRPVAQRLSEATRRRRRLVTRWVQAGGRPGPQPTRPRSISGGGSGGLDVPDVQHSGDGAGQHVRHA
jgi:Mg2+-importing ATPase